MRRKNRRWARAAVAGLVTAAACAVGPIATPPAADAATSAPQQVDVDIAGAYSYANHNAATSGQITAVQAPSGAYTSVNGSLTLPSAVAGGAPATVSVNISGFLGLPLYLGAIDVRDPAANIGLNTFVFFGQVSGNGPGGVATSANWFNFTPPFNLNAYSVRVAVSAGSAPANRPPVASFTPLPATGAVPFTTTLDSSASIDPDGAIVAYAWDFGDGATGAGPNPSHSYGVVGTYPVTLTVTDTDGATASTTVNVTATPIPNVAPNASFTATPGGGIAPQAVAFDASASADPDGTLVNYTWNFGDGTTGNGATASHTYAAAGTYTAALTVTDNLGATATATKSITIAANQLPTASFTTSPASGLTPLAVTLDASASADTDGTIASYAWNFGDGTTGTGKTASHTYGSGTFTATLTVTDDKGGTATTTRTIDANTAPTAAFSGTPLTGIVPFNVNLDASASADADGTIASYAWNFGDGTTGTGKTVVKNYLLPGTYVVTLTVTDNKGAAATQTKTVSAAANKAPTAVISATPVTGDGPLTVSFNGSASSDTDGSIVSYAWDFGNSTTGSGATASKTYDPGTYTARLTVTDDKGATASTTVTITVNTPALTAPANFRRTGQGCCDTYADYAWTAVPYATQYEIQMNPTLGCIATSADVVLPGPTSGRVQKFGLCLGTQYDAKIRAYRNGTWGPWSSTIHFTL